MSCEATMNKLKSKRIWRNTGEEWSSLRLCSTSRQCNSASLRFNIIFPPQSQNNQNLKYFFPKKYSIEPEFLWKLIFIFNQWTSLQVLIRLSTHTQKNFSMTQTFQIFFPPSPKSTIWAITLLEVVCYRWILYLSEGSFKG